MHGRGLGPCDGPALFSCKSVGKREAGVAVMPRFLQGNDLGTSSLGASENRRQAVLCEDCDVSRQHLEAVAHSRYLDGSTGSAAEGSEPQLGTKGWAGLGSLATGPLHEAGSLGRAGGAIEESQGGTAGGA